MKALIRFCTLFDLDLDVYRKTIDKRKFEEYSKRTGEKRYRYKDDKSDVMLAYYSKNVGKNRTEYNESNVVNYSLIGRRRWYLSN